MFEQIGKKIYLTQAGDAMLVHARTIMRHLEAASEEMNDLRGEDSGRLRVAIASTVNYFATQFHIELFGKTFENAMNHIGLTPEARDKKIIIF